MDIALATGIALTAVLGGIAVLLGTFTLPVRIALIVAGIALLSRSAWRLRPSPRADGGTTALALLLLAATATGAAVLAAAGTTEPLRSPWSVVPPAFPALTAGIVALAAYAGLRGHRRALLLGTSATIALGASIALLVYPLGFGFDHFIHAATERIIAASGAITPTPFTYSGHYALAVLLADLTRLPVALADRALAPLLTLMLLVPLLARHLRERTDGRWHELGILALALVPGLPFLVSTPQATANAFALATLLLLPARTDPWRRAFPACATALAALLAQPMAGIIACTAVAIAWGARRWRGVGASVAAATGVAGVPIALALATRFTAIDAAVALHPVRGLSALWHAATAMLPITAADFASADALEVARIALPISWFALAVIGARCARERTLLVFAPITAVLAAITVAMSVELPGQLAAEQMQLPFRLLALAGLLATPLVGIALARILSHARDVRAHQLAFAVSIGALAAFTLLLAYPRDDAQTRSGLWSVSADDIAAVHTIASDAGSAPYVVLAHQMLGAAAVQEFGFRPSTVTAHGEVLSFSLPAGGPIAQQFWTLEAMRPVTRAPVDAAMEITNARRAYVVLHRYWRNAPRLTAETAAIADAEIGAFPSIRIFRFDRRITAAE